MESDKQEKREPTVREDLSKELALNRGVISGILIGLAINIAIAGLVYLDIHLMGESDYSFNILVGANLISIGLLLYYAEHHGKVSFRNGLVIGFIITYSMMFLILVGSCGYTASQSNFHP